jgi:hypothetical protein
VGTRVAISLGMQTSSSMRLRTAFVPWLAALVIGASAHAGWLIHELRDHRDTSADRSFTHTVTIEEPDVHRTRPSVRACRPTARRSVPSQTTSELDFWITRTGRYEYTIDPRMLARVDVAPVVGEIEQLLGIEQGAVELRNIQRETPLWHLGLRTGDRLLSIARSPGADRVEVAVARRGRALVLTYRLVYSP